MRRRSVLVACSLLLGLAHAEEERFDLNDPPKSMRARPYLLKAQEAWGSARPVWEKVKAGEEVDRETLVAAIGNIEEAVLNFERSIEKEWNAEANREEADAAHAWYALREKLPPRQEPMDEEAREEAEREADKARKERLRDARKFIMEYGRAHRYGSQFRKCDRCEGRKELRSPFGDRRPCTRCHQRGVIGLWSGLLHARWHFYSPLYRMNPRRQSYVNRLVRSARFNPKRAEPFIASIRIDGPIEDHDLWLRVNTKQKVQLEADSRRTEKQEKSYILYRIGQVWFLYSLRHDAPLLEIPEAER